jgi:UDP-2,4-diacetamido-2,4,6-trideoxy-beta-L-altropyranose hydrolase
MMGPILLRADASTTMGTGHVMRCLALAQTWQDAGGQAVFVTAGVSPALQERLLSEGIAVELESVEPGSLADARRTVEVARQLASSWVVLDGYHFSSEFQRQIKDAGLRLLVIDDYGHAGHYWADLVLNQNLTAQEGQYERRELYTRLLLGTRYALLRREFQSYRGWRRQTPAVARRVLVTLGGSDPDNATLTVVRTLGRLRLEGLEVVVVLGGANPHREAVAAAAKESPATMEVRCNVTTMAELMAWADVAIAAGGSTTWERALLGLPSLVFVLAENQREIAEACGSAGLGWNLGCPGAMPPEQLAAILKCFLTDAATRKMMENRGVSLIDGLGAIRVRTVLSEGSWTRATSPLGCIRS